MELKFTVDTDDMYGNGEGIDFETLLTDALGRQVVDNCKKGLASDEFKKFAALASDTIVTGIKLKLENFLSEEIALTEGWGKPTFVGSIEDLIKKRFDDVLLRPVDGNGKTVQGCTSSGETWIEWRLGRDLENDVNRHVKKAGEILERGIVKCVNEKIVEIKDSAIKKQVDAAFTSILKQGEIKGI